MTEQPRGILRNKAAQAEAAEAIEFDRQQVIKNTLLNSQLRSENSKGDKIRAKLEHAKEVENTPIEGVSEANSKGDHLKWDEINLYNSEQAKNATMKIDEPKTPYSGGFNPKGEYYQDVPGEDGPGEDADDDIPGFELGEGELDNDVAFESLNGGEVIRDPNFVEEDEEEEEEEESAEERHRRFEAIRKQHYHLKAEALHHKVLVSDEED